MPEHETIEDSGRTRRRAVFKTTLPETATSANNTGAASDSENDSEEEIDMSRVVPLNQVQIYGCNPRSSLKQELRLICLLRLWCLHYLSITIAQLVEFPCRARQSSHADD